MVHFMFTTSIYPAFCAEMLLHRAQFCRIVGLRILTTTEASSVEYLALETIYVKIIASAPTTLNIKWRPRPLPQNNSSHCPVDLRGDCSGAIGPRGHNSLSQK